MNADAQDEVSIELVVNDELFALRYHQIFFALYHNAKRSPLDILHYAIMQNNSSITIALSLHYLVRQPSLPSLSAPLYGRIQFPE